MEEGAIARYLGVVARRLRVSPATRAAIVEELREHLEERADTLEAAGAARGEAERLAVAAFGRPEKLCRQLTLAHASPWKLSHLVGVAALGAATAWGLWLLGTFPIIYQMLTGPNRAIPALPMREVLREAFVTSTPLSQGAFYAFLSVGWPWLLALLALYLVPPILWGARVRRWWAPGLAYGLGTWLSMPWIALPVAWQNPQDGFQAEARLIAAAVPLALLASALGWVWSSRASQPAVSVEDLPA